MVVVVGEWLVVVDVVFEVFDFDVFVGFVGMNCVDCCVEFVDQFGVFFVYCDFGVFVEVFWVFEFWFDEGVVFVVWGIEEVGLQWDGVGEGGVEVVGYQVQVDFVLVGVVYYFGIGFGQYCIGEVVGGSVVLYVDVFVG